MARQGKVEAFEYIADADVAANGGLVQGPKTKINIENLATAAVPDASTTVKGKVELATNAETVTGTDTTRAVTPAGLAAATPKRYVAQLLGDGLTNPTIEAVLINTLGATVTATRIDTGVYQLTASQPVFTENKTVPGPANYTPWNITTFYATTILQIIRTSWIDETHIGIEVDSMDVSDPNIAPVPVDLGFLLQVSIEVFP